MPAGKALAGVTRWYELHPEGWWRDPSRRAKGHVPFLKGCPVPVYMAEVFSDIPQAVRLPREHLRKQIDYFTSTVAWMLAMALDELQRGDFIQLWGIDLSSKAEYHRQRTCVEFWLGVAWAKGINVQMPPTCPLLQGASYAIPEADGVDRLRHISEIDRRLKAAGSESKLASARVHELNGYQRGLLDARALLGGTDT